MTLPDIVSVEEALRPSGEIVVPAGQTRVCGPMDEYRESYRVARIVRYEELQQLRVVPETLDEDVASEAYRADVAAYRSAQSGGGSARHGSGCGCQGESDGRELQAERRNRFRRPDFSNLAQAMESRSRLTAAPTDDLYVRRVAQVLDRYLVPLTPLLWGIVSPKSIDIETNGVLVMSPSVWVVSTGVVTMASGSRWRFESGSVQVNCDELNGPRAVLGPWVLDLIPYLFSAKAASADMSEDEIAREQRIGKYLPGYSRERDWTLEPTT